MKDHLNLLPISFRRRLLFQRRIREWLAIWGAALIAAISLSVPGWLELHNRLRDLEERRRQVLPVQTLITQNDRLRRRITDLKSSQSLLKELETEHLTFHVLGVVSRSAAVCDGRVQVQFFSFDRSQSSLPADPGKDQTKAPPVVEERLVLSLKGISVDNLAVARFVVALRESELFSSVDLKSLAGAPTASPGVRTYLIECAL